MIGKISFAERMKRPKTVVNNSYFYEDTVPQFETVSKDGKILKRLVSKVVDVRDKFKGLKASDFELENLLAVGAVENLKEVTMSQSVLESTDNLTNVAANIDSAVRSIKSE